MVARSETAAGGLGVGTAGGSQIVEGRGMEGCWGISMTEFAAEGEEEWRALLSRVHRYRPGTNHSNTSGVW